MKDNNDPMLENNSYYDIDILNEANAPIQKKINEWNDRLKSLYTQIEYWTNPENKTNKTIEIIQLFYDM